MKLFDFGGGLVDLDRWQEVNLFAVKWIPPPESKWNVRIKELLILYFLHTIYNSMDYLSLAALLLRAYKSTIETQGC